MAKDGEGNDYSPLSTYSLGEYVPLSTWSGELRSTEDSDEDGGCETREINALVLWPVN